MTRIAINGILGLIAAVTMTGSASAEERIKIGYIELANDPTYVQNGAYAGIEFRDLERPRAGATLGAADANAIGAFIGLKFQLEVKTAADEKDIPATMDKLINDGIHFVLADLPAENLARLAKSESQQNLTIFNISSPEDSLRTSDCSRDLLHTIPSFSMRTDAMGEFLAWKKWRRILVLEGPSTRDAEEVEALRRSSSKFGLQIVSVQTFTLARNPSAREHHNIGLITSGADYDVVYVADDSHEYARFVPYQTILPRPIVGDAGLRATAWSWVWDRDGAPQLQHRFEKLATPLRMNGGTWAAWAAVMAVAESALRTKSTDFHSLDSYMRSPALHLDTAKGRAGSFRPWNGQLRQPMVISTDSAAIATAPLPGFLHESDPLDTLGLDQPETECHLD